MEAADLPDPDAAPVLPDAESVRPADETCRALAYWVENDGLLRDEGALFGFAAFRMGEDAAMLDAKLASIAAAYSVHVEREKNLVATLSAEAERLVAERAQARADEAVQEALARTPYAPNLDPYEPAAAHQRLRVAVPGLLALTGAVALGWTVYDLLGRSGLGHPAAATLALTVLGFAGSFQPISVLHARRDVLQNRADHPEMWKLHVSEWLLPLVASVLVGVLARNAFDLPTVVAASAFLFVAFAMVGRLLSGTLTRFAIARRRGREEAEAARLAAETAADAAVRAAAHRAREEACTQRLEALEAERDAAVQRLAVAQGWVTYKQELFRSEYRFGLWVMQARAVSGDDHAPAFALPSAAAPPAPSVAAPPAPGDGAPTTSATDLFVDPDGTPHPRPVAPLSPTASDDRSRL